MILPLVARHAACAPREIDRYAAWQAALRALHQREFAPHRLHELLEDVPAEQHEDALVDLVAADLRRSWAEGAGRCLEQYALPGDPPADLIEEEFLARHTPPHGDLPAVAEYRRRFPSRTGISALLERHCLAQGRYVKLRRIGAGAMGEVWEGCDRERRNGVALKLALPDGEAALAREALLLAALDHPAIPELVGHHDTVLAMRLAHGPTLGELNAGTRHLPFRAPERRRLLLAFVAVCEAVEHAHDRGIAHGDLKPDNVRTDDDGTTLLLDWGLARRAGERGEASGTPEYMAPEQADGVVDEMSDVFGLGALLYELLTGRAPHQWPDGARPADWPRHVRAAVIAPPRRLARVPRALQSICLAALNRDPACRPRPSELARALQSWLTGRNGWIGRLISA